MSFTPEPTYDGSYTFFSPDFEETFHSQQGAKQEAQEKFIIPAALEEKAQAQSSIKLLDICYGLGYNTASAMEAIWKTNPHCHIELIALELDYSVPEATIDHKLLDAWSAPIPNLLTTLAHQQQVNQTDFQGQLLIGDARQTIQQVIARNFLADAIFLDPFSPPHCPQLWTVEFIALVAQCLHENGRLTTYSCAAAMRTALSLAGLAYSSTMGMNRRSTVASWKQDNLPPLLEQDIEHQQTRAAIPYRDLTLEDSVVTILQRRQQEQQNSTLETTTQWRKRWLPKMLDDK